MNQTTSTRDRVLEFIKKEGSVSVKTLTQEIGITPMAIRGHLTKLEKEELIEVQNVRQKLGRPLQVFALTPKGENSFPKSYDTFALDLISDIKALDGGETFQKVIAKREERLEEALNNVLKGAKTPDEKLKLYVAEIETQGTMPQLTKLADNKFSLSVSNCAIFNIASEHKFCCDSEIKVLIKLFPEAKITRDQSTDGSVKGCAYLFIF